MTLRARLALAFIVLLLGPLLVGGLLLTAGLLAGPDEDQARATLREVIAADCRHLQATADGLAVTAGVRGEPLLVAPADAPGPWALCGAPPVDGLTVLGLAARAPVPGGAAGEVAGYAYAVQPLDGGYLARLSAAAGGPVTVVDPGDSDVLVGPAAPLSLGLGPPGPADPAAPGPASVAVVALAAVVASAVLAWWLAGLATRPLEVLLQAVEQASSGDLESRSFIAGRDEAGRLGLGVDQLIGSLQETQRLSVTDALTGLGNLRHLRDSLRREAERASRFGHALGVLALDLDHFKAVNDEYGHRAGDSVLTELARRIRGVIREVDLAFRQGGEEFVVLLPETDIAGSLTAARRLGEAVRDRPFTIWVRRPGGSAARATATHPIPVTVSIGVAVFPRHGGSGSEVLDAADEALYRAKALGRDTYTMATTGVPGQRVTTYVAVNGASGETPSASTRSDG